MPDWSSELRYDPIKPLIGSDHAAVRYFTQRDILQKTVSPIEALWDLKVPRQILRKQKTDGSWKYPGKTSWHTTDYSQLETYREMGFLVQMYGLNRDHPAIEKTAGYFFSKQSPKGDFRGIYANQYSPNYTAGILELLITAGYSDDKHVQKAFDWLLAIRQTDGGWALPLRTKGHNLEVILHDETIEPDASKPFSHLITGIVLRAFAAHPVYCRSPEVIQAGKLLASRFFKKDSYVDLGSPKAWQTFSYPFWNTDLVSSLDILSKLGFSKSQENIQQAIEWLRQKQQSNGLFDLHRNHDRYHDQDLWLTLAICRSIRLLPN